jgi:hypothetical protein
VADTSKHGKKGGGHRANLKKMTRGVTKLVRENQPRIRITIDLEGERRDVEKVLWNMRKPPKDWK